MGTPIDRTGRKYGRLTAVRRAENDKHGNSQWECLCDCGAVAIVSSPSLATGNTKSCGCLSKELAGIRARERSTTHGLSNTRTYKVWAGMRKRCRNPNDIAYYYYGGRGIKVCERWMKFENFLADMGEVPEGMSIERLDVNGDYCPENCVWLPNSEQRKNVRNNVHVVYEGEKMILSDFARKIGRRPSRISTWLKKGFTPEQMLTKPKRKPKGVKA